MAERHNASLDDMDSFPPTVCEHTKYADGYELETIDPDPETNIEVFTN